MTNAERFKSIFGIYATELWAMSEPEFLEWLNVENEPTQTNDANVLNALDCVERQAALDALEWKWAGKAAIDAIKELPSASPRWIPVSERLPDDLTEVNVTWVNHKPESYYESIKDEPFTATAVFYKGKWYWWTTYTQDLLAEYGERCNVGLMDEAIEVSAWMPLPQPWKGER